MEKEEIFRFLVRTIACKMNKKFIPEYLVLFSMLC